MKKIILKIFIIIIAISLYIPVNASDIGESIRGPGIDNAFNSTEYEVSEYSTTMQGSPLNETAFYAGYSTDESNNIDSLTQTIINSILSFLGVIATLLIIYAGFKWMKAQGNQEEVNEAKSMLKNAIIGLIIVLAAYAISIAIFEYFIQEELTIQ